MSPRVLLDEKIRGPIVCVLAAIAYGLLLAVAKAVPRYDCIALPIFLWAIFRRLDDASPRGRTIGLSAVTAVLLGAYLYQLWTLGYEGRNAVFGGILPWSDSHDYYGDALRLMHGDRFLDIGSKRPLYPLALAALLRLTGGDLRLVFVLTAVVSAWAVAIAALEIWKTHGWKSALVVYLLLLFVERRWTGFVQTEHLGLPLGAVAFALAWRASRTGGRRLVLLALYALTLALLARTGSFFVLPAIAIWAARRLVGPDRVEKARFLALAAIVVLGGFALNRFVVATCGRGVMFSDYPGIVYGMMHDEGFAYINQAHPEIARLPAAERVPASWRVVRDETKADPMLLVSGLAKSGGGLFFSPMGMFGYVWTNPDDHVLEDGAAVRASMQTYGLAGPLVLWTNELGLYSLLNAAAMGVMGAALVIASLVAMYVAFVRRRRDPDLSLVRWSFAGVLASAPFLPPSITSGQQTQTATMAFVAALPAVVFLAGRRRQEPAARARGLAAAPALVGAGLVATIVWMRARPVATPPCPRDGRHVVRVFPYTGVVVTASRSFDVGANAERDLRASLPLLDKHNPELVRSVEPFLRRGTRYVSAFDACGDAARILVDDGAVLREREDGSSGEWITIDAARLATDDVLHVVRPQTPVLP